MARVASVLFMLALALPASAAGAARQVRVFQDDQLLLYSGPLVRSAVLDTAKQLGVDVIRAQFVWRNIALSKPSNGADPNAYGTAWSNWDSLVIEASKRGMKVLGTITGPAPSWAAGQTGQFYAGSRYPDAKEFGKFVAAVGRRYSGRARASAALARPAATSRRASASSAGASVFGLLGPSDCTPIPPLVTCDPDGNPVILPPPPEDGGGGGGGGEEPSPPPSSGEQSPPPPPGSGTPTPPPPPGTKIPRIRLWSIYNEPNHPLFLSPQRKRRKLVAPSLYRKLYRAAWTSLARTGHRRDTILIGETLPIGSNANRETATTSPLRFARELFCLNGRGRRHPGCNGRFRPLQASGWAIHPYYRRTGPFSRPPGRDDVTPATLGKLRRLLARAARRGRLARRVPIWDTENGSQTRPPDPKGTSLARQARYVNEAEFIAWRRPWLRSFSQYLLTDEQPVWAFQSGLMFRDGKAKPALSSYRLPIFVRRLRRGVLVWGRSPGGAGSVVTIDPARGRDVRVRVPGGSGYFTKRLRRRASSYLLRYGDLRSRRARPSAR